MATLVQQGERRLHLDDDDALSDVGGMGGGDDQLRPMSGGSKGTESPSVGAYGRRAEAAGPDAEPGGIGEEVMSVVRAGMEELLWAVEKEGANNIRPLRWLADYLKAHNITNTHRAVQQAKSAAIDSLSSADTRYDIYWRSVGAIRSVMWPCSARLLLLSPLEEQVLVKLTPEEEAARVEAEAAAQAAAQALAAQQAAMAAAAADPKKGGDRAKSPAPRGTTPPNKDVPAKGGAKGRAKSPREETPPPIVEAPPPPPPPKTKTVHSTVLRVTSTSHIDPDTCQNLFLRRSEGVSWAAVEGEVSLLVRDVLDEPQMMFFDKRRAPGSYLAVPVWEGGKVVGVVGVDSLLDGRELGEEDLEFVESIADVMSDKLDIVAEREERERREKEAEEERERERLRREEEEERERAAAAAEQEQQQGEGS